VKHFFSKFPSDFGQTFYREFPEGCAAAIGRAGTFGTAVPDLMATRLEITFCR
jgi:hypothetical protein